MNGLVKTLIKPDWDDNPKRSEILHAANLLQIGEFQLIQLAYKVWYKQDLPEEKINKIFSHYMISGIIPIWVTYYARDIIKMEKARVIQVIEEDKRGYKAIQLGYGKIKSSKLTKAMKGYFAKRNTEAKKNSKNIELKILRIIKREMNLV